MATGHVARAMVPETPGRRVALLYFVLGVFGIIGGAARGDAFNFALGVAVALPYVVLTIRARNGETGQPEAAPE